MDLIFWWLEISNKKVIKKVISSMGKKIRKQGDREGQNREEGR